MTRVVAVLLAGLAMSFAAAFEFPSDAQIVVHAEGQVVGQGSFEDGDLTLDLLADFSGFATITVADTAGGEFSFEVMISREGNIMLAEEAGDVYLSELVQGETSISFRESLSVEVEKRVSNAFGAGVPEHVNLPEVAVAGQARAAANHAEARAKAESSEEADDASVAVGAEWGARGEASVGARRGDARADAAFRFGVGVRGDAEAGGSVEVGMGVSVGGGRED